MDWDFWGPLIGVACAMLLAFIPWMLMVHAKLAVLGNQMADVAGKIDKLFEREDNRLVTCAQHISRVNEHERRLASLESQVFKE